MHTDNRPLSPHLSIYRPQISSVMSILHRITGVALGLGTVLLVWWLWAAAYSPECYEGIQQFLASLFGQILLVGWSVAFYYHLSNGIRHLFWDMGVGFSIPAMTKSGVVVLIATVVMTLITWYCVWF